MTDKFNKLNETFGLRSEVISKEIKLNQKLSEEDIQKDYEYTRGNLYSLIEKGQEDLNGALELAQETDSPRAYEVTGQLIKSISDATDKLLDLQKKLKEVNAEEKQKGPSTVNNALFVGSTAELAKMLKNGLKENDK